MTNTLHITDASGDTRIMWNPRDKDEVAAAKAAFDAAKGRGMLAYSVDPESGDSTGEVIREFDKKHGKIIMVRQTAGG
jgi:hypothetical protein